MQQITIDTEFKALIPPLGDEELAQLEANIVADGVREPLVVWPQADGVMLLVDGHNRHAICSKRGIEYQTVLKDFMDRDAATLWIIDNQMGRRNVSDIDRIALQLKRKAVVAAKARESQVKNLKRGAESPVPAKLPKRELTDTPPPATKIDTRRELARAAGVGERTFDAGAMVLDAAEKGEIPKEDIEAIRRKEKSIHRVARDIKDARQKKARNEVRQEAAAATPVVDNRIILGDFRAMADQVADNSVSLIFTDPPYDRKASSMLPDLAEFAARKLAPGGSLICYVGQTQLPAALDAFRKHLRYWWTIACVHGGRSTVMREYGVNAGWKAVLWFVKETRHDNSVMVNDVMSGGEEKAFHDWQQSQSEAEYWIQKLCPPDGLVCDPFMGGGTTGAAAQKLGRKWIGFEIDEPTALRASSRVAS